MARERFIDNPPRVPASHPLVKAGKIRVKRVRDLNSEASISLHAPEVYLGRCDDCPDVCGIGWETTWSK